MELKAKDLAEYLDVPLDTLERWIRQGRIPVNKNNDICEFNENTLKKWASAHNLKFRSRKKKSEQGQDFEQEPLAAVIKRGGILYDVKGDTPEMIFESVVGQLTTFSEDTRQELFVRLMEREKMMSTGIGNGVAIPHPRTPLDELEKSIIVSCFLKQPVDFNAIDARPVFCLFMILSTSIKMHLHLLSSLTFLLRQNSFISFLKKSPDEVAFFQHIKKMEKTINY